MASRLEALLEAKGAADAAPNKGEMHNLNWPRDLQWPHGLYNLDPHDYHADDSLLVEAIQQVVETVGVMRSISMWVDGWASASETIRAIASGHPRTDFSQEDFAVDITPSYFEIGHLVEHHRDWLRYGYDARDRCEPPLRTIADWVERVVDAAVHVEDVHDEVIGGEQYTMADAERLETARDDYVNAVYSLEPHRPTRTLWNNVTPISDAARRSAERGRSSRISPKSDTV